MATRQVIQGDGIAWLRQAALTSEHAIVTSLPDLSELPDMTFDAWRLWFVDVAELIFRTAADDAVCVFYQTDIKHDGRWIDKAHLVHSGADAAGAHCLWHKIACRTTAGNTTFGRPAYGHWLGFSKTHRIDVSKSSPDVLPELGNMTWSRAFPESVARATCSYLLSRTSCRVVVDPFCGRGTILAHANSRGLDAIGVELAKKRARTARTMVLGTGASAAGGDHSDSESPTPRTLK